MESERRAGTWYAVAAYVAWGVLPIYWKLLHGVPALQVVGHRILWSLVVLITVLFIRREWRAFRRRLGDRRLILIYLGASLLIGINWLTYIYGVTSGHIVETSLGYFINPLFNLLLGLIVLRERLRPWQWVAVGIATAGVLYLTFSYGAIPWISLILASTFALYGLLKKRAPLGSLPGLTLETGILFLPALLYLLFCQFSGTGGMGEHGMAVDLLLVGAGIATTIPLLLFASAAQRIPLSTIGILQYIAPSMQFLIGVLLYNEEMTQDRLIGFSFVWLALLLFGIESRMNGRREREVIVRDRM